MIRKFIGTASLTTLLLTNSVLPALAEEATTTKPDSRGASECMRQATAKKKTAFRAAEEAWKNARKQAREIKNREALAKARDAYKMVKRTAKNAFEADRKACLSQLRAERKREEGDQERRAVNVVLSALNNSGESGTAVLKPEDGKTEVKLRLVGAPSGVTQPAHIHGGSCASLGDIKYPLTFPVNGKSETELNVTMEKLKSELPLAINVHKSTTEAGVYVACGDVKF